MTAFEIALAAFLQSPEGKACMDIHTLENAKSQADMEKFIKARLVKAFAAAWDAYSIVIIDIMKEHMGAEE